MWLIRPRMPPNKRNVPEIRPIGNYGRGTSVDGERNDGGESEKEAAVEEMEVGRVVAPWGEEGEVKMGNGREAGGEEDEVADFTAEREGCARWAFERAPLAAGEGDGVAGANVEDKGEGVREEGVGEVVEVR